MGQETYACVETSLIVQKSYTLTKDTFAVSLDSFAKKLISVCITGRQAKESNTSANLQANEN